jgi:hypothetical protein
MGHCHTSHSKFRVLLIHTPHGSKIMQRNIALFVIEIFVLGGILTAFVLPVFSTSSTEVRVNDGRYR